MLAALRIFVASQVLNHTVGRPRDPERVQMPRQNSQHRGGSDEVSRRLKLLHELESGMLDSLECPDCHKQTVSVWFSHPEETDYRTWFVCSDCSFRMRAQNTGCPRFYSEKRLSHELDVYDSRLLGMTLPKKEEPAR